MQLNNQTFSLSHVCFAVVKGLEKTKCPAVRKVSKFVQNPFFSSFESILSSFIITKRSGKQEWLCSRVVVVSKVRGRVDAVSTLDKIS